MKCPRQLPERLQLRDAPHQRQIASVAEEFIDIAHGYSVFVFMDSFSIVFPPAATKPSSTTEK